MEGFDGFAAFGADRSATGVDASAIGVDGPATGFGGFTAFDVGSAIRVGSAMSFDAP